MKRQRTVTIPAQMGLASWTTPTGGTGQFRPNGPVVLVPATEAAPMNPNPYDVYGGVKTLAARMFVGLNVGGKPTWDVDDVVHAVRAERGKQKVPADASFLLQRGIYTHTPKRGRKTVIEENSVQVVIVKMPSEPERTWRPHLIRLAERLAQRLKQASVILELQRGGLVTEVLGVRPY
jgi:hypothetical protein